MNHLRMHFSPQSNGGNGTNSGGVNKELGSLLPSQTIMNTGFKSLLLEAQQRVSANPEKIVEIARSYMKEPHTIHDMSGKAPPFRGLTPEEWTSIDAGFALIEPKVRELIEAGNCKEALSTLLGVIYQPASKKLDSATIHGNGFFLTEETATAAVKLINEIIAKANSSGIKFEENEIRDAVRMRIFTSGIDSIQHNFTSAQISHELAKPPGALKFVCEPTFKHE